MIIAFNKPYGVLSQFTPDGSRWKPLAEFNFPPRVYPIGRLDAESEGLLLLSDEAGLNAILLHPRHGHHRIYWVQVEGAPEAATLLKLADGALVEGRPTLPCKVWKLEPPPMVPPRNPPIRFRKSVPDSWIGMDLIEGKNRQVRRMTAAAGHPTLRLWRAQIGRFLLTDQIAPGAWKVLLPEERQAVLQR